MTDARRRLRLVTEAAYAPGPTEADEHSAPSGPEPAQDGPSHAPTPAHEAHAADPWPPVEDFRGHRWGTPALLAVRVGVVVLVLAVAAAVAVMVTRPSAPAHQPELAWPAPPEQWDAGGGEAGGAGPAGQGGLVGPDAAHPGAEDGAPGDSADPGAAGAGTKPAGVLVVVHVAGAVHTPGIVEVSEHARVHEAINAAGGASEEADLAALNLAAPVQDGQQVYVPVHGEEPRQAPPDAGGAATNSAPAATGPAAVVDLNTAGTAELQTLPGIGPAIAGRILAHRDEHGPFNSVDDLLAVSGIGPATLENLRDLVTV